MPKKTMPRASPTPRISPFLFPAVVSRPRIEVPTLRDSLLPHRDPDQALTYDALGIQDGLVTRHTVREKLDELEAHHVALRAQAANQRESLARVSPFGSGVPVAGM